MCWFVLFACLLDLAVLALCGASRRCCLKLLVEFARTISHLDEKHDSPTANLKPLSRCCLP